MFGTGWPPRSLSVRSMVAHMLRSLVAMVVGFAAAEALQNVSSVMVFHKGEGNYGAVHRLSYSTLRRGVHVCDERECMLPQYMIS